jgi:hypothetical protein
MYPKKIIISRKGFDTGNGHIPSPIMEDGTLLSLPIPSKKDVEVSYGDLFYNGKKYSDIIQSLSPNTKIKDYYHCHLDPDIRMEVRNRSNDWHAAFGQEGMSLSHLRKQGVSQGDLFIFFGLFRQTINVNGLPQYVKGTFMKHVIFGYFQICDIIDEESKLPDWLKDHPHFKHERWVKNNAIFTATDHLSFAETYPGYGCLKYNENLDLTQKGSRRVTSWNLPYDTFGDVAISFHKNAWQEDGFRSVSKGQEFVLDANEKVMKWVVDRLLQK